MFWGNHNKYQKSRAPKNLHIYAICWTKLNQNSQTYLNSENIFCNTSSNILRNSSFWDITSGNILLVIWNSYLLLCYTIFTSSALTVRIEPIFPTLLLYVSSHLDTPTHSLNLLLLMTWYHSVILSPLEFAGWDILSAND